MPSAKSANVRYLIGSSLASKTYSVARPLSRLSGEWPRSPTARFGAIAKPLPHGRGSDQSRDRQGAVAVGKSTILCGRGTSLARSNTRARLHPVLKLAAASGLPLPEDLLVQFYAESRPFGLQRETVLHHGRIPGQGEDATVPAGHRRFTGEEVHDREAGVNT